MSDNDDAYDKFMRQLSESFLVAEDTELDCEFNARDLLDGTLSVNKPQLRAINHLHDKVVVEVLVEVNALALKLEGKAIQKANQPCIELSYLVSEPAGESAMSVMLWELTYTFNALPGNQYFNFEFTGEGG